MKEIHHSLTEQDLKNAVYQYLRGKGMSEGMRPRSPDSLELVWGTYLPGKFEGRDPIVCTAIEIREEI